jgi:intraflagellar transport protein 122
LSSLQVMRALAPDQLPLVAQCAALFRKWGSHGDAKEAYIKLGDIKSLMALHVELNKWDDAFLLLKAHPEFADVVGWTLLEC